MQSGYSGANILKTVDNNSEFDLSVAAVDDQWNADLFASIYESLTGTLDIYVCFNASKNIKSATVWFREGNYVSENKSENYTSIFSITNNSSDNILNNGQALHLRRNGSFGKTYTILIDGTKNNNTEFGGYIEYTTSTELTPPKSVYLDRSSRDINFTVGDKNAQYTCVEFSLPDSETEYPFNKYSKDVRKLFYKAACTYSENYLPNEYWTHKFKTWSHEEHTIGINFMSSVTDSMLIDAFKSYVGKVVDIINNTITSGFSLKIIDGITGGSYSDIENRNGKGEIQIWWGNYKELWNTNVPDDYRYFGQWSNNWDENNQYITKGTVKLCTEKVWMMNYQGVTFEEIVECLGVGSDVTYTSESLFSDFWFPAKSINGYGTSTAALSPYSDDLEVLRLAYNHNGAIYLPSNTDATSVAIKINAPNGLMMYSHNINSVENSYYFSYLSDIAEIGDEYTLRVFSCGSSYGKYMSDPVTINGKIKPRLWSWTSPNTYDYTLYKRDLIKKANNIVVLEQFSKAEFKQNFSAWVWNLIVDKTIEYLKYNNKTSDSIGSDGTRYGLKSSDSLYYACNKSMFNSGDEFTANKYNILRFIIGSMSSTGLNDFSKGDVIKGSYFSKLTDALNKI